MNKAQKFIKYNLFHLESILKCLTSIIIYVLWWTECVYIKKQYVILGNLWIKLFYLKIKLFVNKVTNNITTRSLAFKKKGEVDNPLQWIFLKMWSMTYLPLGHLGCLLKIKIPEFHPIIISIAAQDFAFLASSSGDSCACYSLKTRACGPENMPISKLSYALLAPKTKDWV